MDPTSGASGLRILLWVIVKVGARCGKRQMKGRVCEPEDLEGFDFLTPDERVDFMRKCAQMFGPELQTNNITEAVARSVTRRVSRKKKKGGLFAKVVDEEKKCVDQ